jgi:gamma-glutamylputrescine oxidase
VISFWERDHWFSNIDFTIIGGGFTGHFTALALREKDSHANILLIERDAIAAGASTKNAGFACFGSVGELLDDLQDESEEIAFGRVQRRFAGLQKLRSIIPDEQCDYSETGGHELFRAGEEAFYQKCLEHIEHLNNQLKPLLGFAPYVRANTQTFGFKNMIGGIAIKREGMLHPGKALAYLQRLCAEKGITSLHGTAVNSIASEASGVRIHTNRHTFTSKKVILATNAFTPDLQKHVNSKPCRGQVLITSSIPDLKLNGTYHMDRGYYYFRNVGKRVLLGGARNLDYQGETSDTFELNEQIQQHLEEILRNTLLPNTNFTIEQRWSGIMAFGKADEKEPVIREIEPNIISAFRLGGMGVALSAQVGHEAAVLALDRN